LYSLGIAFHQDGFTSFDMLTHAYGVRTFFLSIFAFSSFLRPRKNDENANIDRKKSRGTAKPCKISK
jgi:hypothetical protein